MKLKEIAATLLVATLALGTMVGCGSKGNDNTADSADQTGASGDITILSREDGSGTRGAFVELFGIEEKDADGNKVDMTTEDAKITNSTSVMMTTVAGDVNSLGYISLGSLNDTVTAVKIDGVEATADNVSNGTYKIARPFNIATKGEDLSDAAQDFVNYILSKDGQQIITDNGYISVGEGKEFTSNNASGKLSDRWIIFCNTGYGKISRVLWQRSMQTLRSRYRKVILQPVCSQRSTACVTSVWHPEN